MHYAFADKIHFLVRNRTADSIDIKLYIGISILSIRFMQGEIGAVLVRHVFVRIVFFNRDLE